MRLNHKVWKITVCPSLYWGHWEAQCHTRSWYPIQDGADMPPVRCVLTGNGVTKVPSPTYKRLVMSKRNVNESQSTCQWLSCRTDRAIKFLRRFHVRPSTLYHSAPLKFKIRFGLFSLFSNLDPVDSQCLSSQLYIFIYFSHPCEIQK